MINFSSRSFIAPAQSVTKAAPATDAATDSSKTVAAPAAPTASQGSAKSGAIVPAGRGSEKSQESMARNPS